MLSFCFRYLLILLLILSINLYSQSFSPPQLFQYKIENGDTIYIGYIDDVYVFSHPRKGSKRDLRKLARLIYNVKKVYPYSQIAKLKYYEINQNLAKLHTEKERKEYLKSVEKELFKEYEDEIRSLTITQGRILLKLIDREIGKTSYTLLKEYRGAITASFWQAVARIFGTNLKARWDPEGEDRLINEIVILIEAGVL